jgi:glutathione S-transferase
MLLYVDSQYASPYAMSVFVGLKEKGIPFDMQALDLGAGANRTADYAATSLTQRVPTLVEGDFHLSESSAITEYLDEMYPGTALYPTAPKAKARARQIQSWLRSDLLPIRQERPTEVLFYRRTDAPLSDAAKQAAQKLFRAADTLLVQDREHLFDAWCIADLDLALMLNRLVMNGDAVPARLADYARKQWQRASVQAWVSLPRPPL